MNDLSNEIKSHPLYQEAFNEFKKGNREKGYALLSKLNENEKIKKNLEEYSQKCGKYSQNFVGIIPKDSDKKIPNGFTKNSFTNNTKLLLQQKDKPEWKDIIAQVLYEGKPVYEDYYMFSMGTDFALFQ